MISGHFSSQLIYIDAHELGTILLKQSALLPVGSSRIEHFFDAVDHRHDAFDSSAMIEEIDQGAR